MLSIVINGGLMLFEKLSFWIMFFYAVTISVAFLIYMRRERQKNHNNREETESELSE